MRMEEFTMRNFLKQWKAILPLAIILTFAGLIAGVAYGATRTQSYSATNEVLVINSMESALPDDYVAIAKLGPYRRGEKRPRMVENNNRWFELVASLKAFINTYSN